jgi:hypothetical protein
MTPDNASETPFDAILASVAAHKHDPAALNQLLIGTLVALKRATELNALLAAAPDRAATGTAIQAAIDRIHGSGFALTGHAISRTIDSRYSPEQKRMIVRTITAVCDRVAQELGVTWFVTSGTLLGLVREGGFIKHDDDLDVAYVSTEQSEAAIVAQRRRIYTLLNAIPDVRAQDCAGGHFWVFWKSPDLQFMFDLFTAFVRDGRFNEYPLRPMTLSAERILPTKDASLYGERTRVPRDPEALLELNYGPGWRVPDPNFRFNFGEHNAFYRFLLGNKIAG